MKQTIKYLTTFKVGRVTPLMATVILCLLMVNAMLWQSSGVFAADNANVPDYSTLYLTNDPHANFSDGWWSGTTFAGETVLSIVIGESRNGLEWNKITWDFQTNTDGTWAGTGIYKYRDMIYDSKSRKDTFTGTLTSSVVGGEWWIHAYDIDGM